MIWRHLTPWLKHKCSACGQVDKTRYEMVGEYRELPATPRQRAARRIRREITTQEDPKPIPPPEPSESTSGEQEKEA